MPDPILVKAIYTDGACSGNPGPGGWGVVIQFTDGQQHELGGGNTQTTNNQMELQAAIEAVKALRILPQLAKGACVYTDSEYVKNGITKWMTNWKKRGWQTAQGKAVLNQTLWKELDDLNPLQIEWQYIKAHAGHPGNERADAIARAFSLKQVPALSQANFIDKMTKHPATIEPAVPVEAIRASSSPAPESIPHKDCDLQSQVSLLQTADTIAERGFLITSSELAQLLDWEVSTLDQQNTPWVWRNWQVLPVQTEENQRLWQLERVHPPTTARIPSSRLNSSQKICD